MKYRIKVYHYKDYSRYYPQWRFLWLWNNFNDKIYGSVYFSSEIKALEFINKDIDLQNPKVEKIPYETNKETRTGA
jgi:hypothetical protein